MFHSPTSTQGNTQDYSPFGTYVVEQHDAVCRERYIDDLPNADFKPGQELPLAQHVAKAS